MPMPMRGNRPTPRQIMEEWKKKEEKDGMGEVAIITLIIVTCILLITGAIMSIVETLMHG